MVILKLIVTNEIIIAYVTICYDKYIFHGKLGNIVLSLFFFLVTHHQSLTNNNWKRNHALSLQKEVDKNSL